MAEEGVPMAEEGVLMAEGVPVPEGGVPVPEEGVLMAEGGVPPIVPYRMALIFSRDLIIYVMRRRFPFWDFEVQYGGRPPLSPFTSRISRAVEYYLAKEDINIYFRFAESFTELPMDYPSFVQVANNMVDSVYPDVRTPSDFIRLVALFAQFTTLAYKGGIHLAPDHAVFEIRDLIQRYVRQIGIPLNVFLADLGTSADDMIREYFRASLGDSVILANLPDD